MKRTILTQILLFPLYLLHAQDIVFQKTGDELKVKITEVNIDNIKYRKFDNLNGPVYTMEKSSVFMIKYANGTKDVFNTATLPSVEKPTAPAVENPKTHNQSPEASIPLNNVITPDGNLIIDNPSELFATAPLDKWNYTIVDLSSVADFCSKAGFPQKTSDFTDFFATTNSKTRVTDYNKEATFIAFRMIEGGKTIGSVQQFSLKKNVLLPTGMISKAIYFTDKQNVEHHVPELYRAISQELAQKGNSHVGIMYDGGNMSELILYLSEGSLLDLEFYNIWHKAGTFNPSDYNIKFYPNAGLSYVMSGFMFDDKLQKYRVSALRE